MFLSFLCVELSYSTSADKCMVFWEWFSHLKPKFHCAIFYFSVVKSFWDFVQSTIISQFRTLGLHIIAETAVWLDFRNLYYYFFPNFMFENLRVNVSFKIVSRRIYSGTIRVETSRCRCRISLPGKQANIARSWDLFPKYASCTHLKVKPLLISTYTFDINIRWNKIAIYSVRFDVKSTWFDSLLCYSALFHSTAYPRWWVAFLDRQTNSMPKIRCRRNGSLDNDDTEKSLILSTLHKWNQHIWHRSRTLIFLFFLSAVQVDRKSVRIYCPQHRLFTVP